MNLSKYLLNHNYKYLVKIIIPYALLVEVENIIKDSSLNYINISALILCSLYLIYTLIRPTQSDSTSDINDMDQSMAEINNQPHSNNEITKEQQDHFVEDVKDNIQDNMANNSKTDHKESNSLEEKNESNNDEKPDEQSNTPPDRKKLSLIQSINQDFHSEYSKLLFTINKLEEFETLNNPLDYNKVLLNQHNNFEHQDKDISTLLSKISKMKNLKQITIQKYELDTIPFKFTNLRKLKELDLSLNNIAKLPDEIQDLTSLEKLILKDNQLIDFPLNAIKKLKNHHLRYIDLRANPNISLTTKDELKQIYQALEEAKLAKIIID